MSIQEAYSDIVAQDSLIPDTAQQSIVSELQRLQTELEATPTRVRRLAIRLGFAGSATAPQGVYLWGGVGRGKTFLMDLFFGTLNIEHKRRIHFHRMMREVHERLKQIDNTEDPLDEVAAAIAREARVLCFDEFFVTDIGDAMVLGRLMECLFARGVTLVATSNSPPGELYRDGLQRERFLPAIGAIERHTRVIEMDSGVDYRLRLMQQAGTFLSPADERANRRLQEFFHNIAPGDSAEGRVLDILGREVRALRCAKGVVWFDFMDICDGPRSQNDYIEIARWYQTVVISEVPVLDRKLENQARRFISLVDEFYDRRVKLILSAAAGVDELYRGSRLAFEFRRTASRLTEMQSEEYLHAAHIA